MPSDGSRLVLTTSALLDRNGDVLGPSITPDVRCANAEEAVEQAIAWLRGSRTTPNAAKQLETKEEKPTKRRYSARNYFVQ